MVEEQAYDLVLFVLVLSYGIVGWLAYLFGKTEGKLYGMKEYTNHLKREVGINDDE